MTARVRTADVPGGGRVIELCRTERANALDPTTVQELGAELDRAAADGVPLVVLSSAGPVFCAGLDLDAAQQDGDTSLAPLLLAIADLLDLLRHVPYLTAASIHGPAVGAGADLAIACDYRVGTDATTFRFPGSRFGLLLGTRHLTRVVGGDAARDILLQDRRVRTEESLRLGLLTSVRPEHDSRSLAVELAGHTRALDPATLRRMLAVTRTTDAHEDRLLVEESLAVGGMAARLDRFAATRGTPTAPTAARR